LDSIHGKVITVAFYRADNFFPKVNTGESVVIWAAKVYFTLVYIESCAPIIDRAISSQGSKTV